MSLSGVGKVLFMYDNAINYATLSASSEATPATRVLSKRAKRRWYATDKDEEWIQAEFTDNELIQHIGLVGFNGDTQALTQSILKDAAGFTGTTLADTGDIDLWLPVAGFGFDGFGVSAGGYPTLSARNDYRPYRFIDLGQRYNTKSLRTYIKNPTNDLISQTGLGWWFAGIGFQPSWTFKYNWNWRWVDPSEITELENGGIASRDRKTYRELYLEIADLNEAEAIGPWNTMLRAIGKTKPIYAVLFPEGGTPLQMATGIWGLRISDDGITNTNSEDFETSITIRELPT